MPLLQVSAGLQYLGSLPQHSVCVGCPLARLPQPAVLPPSQPDPCIVTVCLLTSLPQRRQITPRQGLCLVQHCEPCVYMAGSRRPNLVYMNDDHMGAWVLGTQGGLMYPLGVIDRQRGTGAGGGRDCFALAKPQPRVPVLEPSPCDLCLFPP